MKTPWYLIVVDSVVGSITACFVQKHVKEKTRRTVIYSRFLKTKVRGQREEGVHYGGRYRVKEGGVQLCGRREGRRVGGSLGTAQAIRRCPLQTDKAD